MNERNGMVKGNMSTLEQKVDVLVRCLLAQTETERNACYGDLRQMQRNTSQQRQDASLQIENILQELGIPETLSGYSYMQSAVCILLQKPELRYALTTEVYPMLARIHKTKPGAIERAIRHAIERGWSRCDEAVQQAYFANQIEPDRAKPTNAQFLIRIANVVRRSFSGLPS